MLSKLLKHEFRATGRTMLPIYGAVVVLALLANLSIRLLDTTNNTVLSILFFLVIAAFVIGIIAAAVMTTVVMISRFYRNLLKEQGYLMHTLPVSVHGQIWSKLIVSFVWFLVTFLVIWLVILLTALVQSGTNLGEIFIQFPTWAEIRDGLAELGIRSGDIWLLIVEILAAAILGCLVLCLHFYAAMALGHMFAKDKVLLSIVFFVAISFVFNLFSSGFGIHFMVDLDAGDYAQQFEAAASALAFLRRTMLYGLLISAAQGAVLYVATALGLKRGLNLA